MADLGDGVDAGVSRRYAALQQRDRSVRRSNLVQVQGRAHMAAEIVTNPAEAHGHAGWDALSAY